MPSLVMGQIDSGCSVGVETAVQFSYNNIITTRLGTFYATPKTRSNKKVLVLSRVGNIFLNNTIQFVTAKFK